MPSPILLTETGYDRAAVMRCAWQMAREQQATNARYGNNRPVRDFLGSAIQIAWTFAREQKELRNYAPEKREAVQAAYHQLELANGIDGLPAWKSATDAAYRAIEEART